MLTAVRQNIAGFAGLVTPKLGDADPEDGLARPYPEPYCRGVAKGDYRYNPPESWLDHPDAVHHNRDR